MSLHQDLREALRAAFERVKRAARRPSVGRWEMPRGESHSGLLRGLPSRELTYPPDKDW